MCSSDLYEDGPYENGLISDNFANIPASQRKLDFIQELFNNKIIERIFLDDGYLMIQFSVYARPCNGHDGVDKHSSRLLANLPTEGSVRCLPVTETQYARMGIHVGKKTVRERKSGPQPITFFDILWAENPEDTDT